jgi:hypothetical protein
LFVEPLSALLVRGGQPLSSNDRQERLARGDAPFDDVNEVGSGVNATHIHEDELVAELGLQPVKQAPRLTSGIVTKDAGHGSFIEKESGLRSI